MKEIWKDVVGYEKSYEVSNLGRVRSKRRFVSGRGRGLHASGGRLIKPFNRYAYVGVVLSQNGKATQYYLHRVVATAFVPNPNNRAEVNHKDGDKHNNVASNLEWVSHSENGLHAYRIGLRVRAKIVNNKRVVVCDCNGAESRFFSIADAAQFIGISQSSVSRWCNGKYKSPMKGKYEVRYA